MCMTGRKLADGGDFGRAEELDVYFKSLSHPMRRSIVRILIDSEEIISLGELVNKLSSPNDNQEEEEMRNILKHRHLPTLEKYGLIRYDEADEKVVDKTDPLAKRLLDAVDE